MPAKLTGLDDDILGRAVNIGAQLRARRKLLKVSATAAAEAAGMSRVTWYRLEKGETSVTFGAYLGAMKVLGLVPAVMVQGEPRGVEKPYDVKPGWIPARIALADYPQLKELAWQLQGVDYLTPREALGIYERNTRHLEEGELLTHEKDLIDALHLVFADEVLNV